MMEGSELLKMTVALFVMVDPLGAAPLFLSLTARHTRKERLRTAWQAALAATCILLIGGVGGEAMLGLFGISIGSFRVIGGILFLLIALDMLNVRPSRTKQTPEEESEASRRHDVALVPMAVPMLAGPGALSTVLLFTSSAGTAMGKGIVLGIVVGMGVVAGTVLSLAGPIGHAFGPSGIRVLTRLMGLVTGAIGVEHIVGGLKAMLPALGG